MASRLLVKGVCYDAVLSQVRVRVRVDVSVGPLHQYAINCAALIVCQDPTTQMGVYWLSQDPATQVGATVAGAAFGLAKVTES